MRGTDLQLSYWLRGNTPFKAEYLLVNRTDEDRIFTISCLVDYKQYKFLLNDQMAISHSVLLKSGEQNITRIELPLLKRGAHDFILLVTHKPNLLGPVEVPGYQVQFHRANIFVDGITFPNIDQLSLGIEPAVENKPYTPIVNLTNDYDHFVPLVTDQVEIDQIRTYFVHINNPDDLPISSALVVFLNGKQITIDSKTEQEVLYWRIREKRQDVVPVTLKVPACRAGCELLVLTIENPYTRLEAERGVMSQHPTRVRPANELTLYSAHSQP